MKVKVSKPILALMLLAVFVVVFVCGFVYVWMSKYEFTVRITDDGFAPNIVSVPVGAKVTWINDSSQMRWPASNPHPDHSEYPSESSSTCDGFDACHGLKHGESFSFTFNLEGEWNYHDHFFAGQVGQIHVTKKLHWLLSFFNDKKLVETESNALFKDLTYDKQLAVLQNLSASEGWRVLKEAYTVDGMVIGEAHELAHIIGNRAYMEKGFDGVTVCDPVFAYGCYHGVTEEFLTVKGPEYIPEAEQTCARLFDKTTDTVGYQSCIHGIGHGLITWVGLNVRPALELCNTLTLYNRDACYDGVFMEYQWSSSDAVSETDQSKLWNVCVELDAKYHRSCAKYQILEASEQLENDVAKVLKWCETAPTTTLKNECVVSTGHSIAISAWADPVAIVAYCSDLRLLQDIAMCVTSAGEELVFQKFEQWKQNTEILCNTLPKEFADECSRRIELYQ